MRFLNFSRCCARCGQPVTGGLRSSAQLSSGKVVRLNYCALCQQSLTIGPTARAVEATRQLWPSGRKEAA
ncbi:MAG TPA: hypothetical protein VGN95_25145 [Pyrinomonadaceae bacterium]|jgi:hypothetical protein|nr:hypothetical protein [Pyrinomonadaceae bacterium]